jgi:hypothetical protein
MRWQLLRRREPPGPGEAGPYADECGPPQPPGRRQAGMRLAELRLAAGLEPPDRRAQELSCLGSRSLGSWVLGLSSRSLITAP